MIRGPKTSRRSFTPQARPGEPKGVMLTHSNIVSNLIDSSNHLSFGQDDSALSVLPLSHVFERTAMNMYLHHGMGVYFGEALEKIGDNLREVHPTVFVGVPRIYEKIFAAVYEPAAGKRKTEPRAVNWAIEVGRKGAVHRQPSACAACGCALKHKLASRRSSRNGAKRWAVAFASWSPEVRRCQTSCAAFPGVRAADRSGLWVDGDVAGNHRRRD